MDIQFAAEYGIRLGGNGSGEWAFWRILRHFSRSSSCPGVERQFAQLGALDDEEFFVIEGSGVALTPGVSPRFQATSR